MQEGPACGAAPTPRLTVPLVLRLADTLTPQSLRRVRFYADLLANPPPPPHPFGAFLLEAARLKAAVATETEMPVVTAEFAEKGITVAAAGGGNDDDDDDDDRKVCTSIPPLPSLLQQGFGHSSGSALHRVWVRHPQEYLSLMAQRIADLVLTRALPSLLDHKRESAHNRNDESTDHEDKAMFIAGAADRYDIHVRFLPSPAASTMVDVSVSQAFCAEIIVRDVKTMRHLDEVAALLRAQYTAVAAEGQTVRSALDFWRGVKGDAAVGEESGPFVDGSLKGVVLGRASERTASKRLARFAGRGGGGSCVWMQPPNKRPRYATAVSSSTGPQRTATRASVSESLRGPLQSTAGLVAVFYLAFSGTLYTGAAFCTPPGVIPPHAAAAAETTVPQPDTRGSDDGQGDDLERNAKNLAASPSAAPVFFLPCSASTSFVRGLLGL